MISIGEESSLSSSSTGPSASDGLTSRTETRSPPTLLMMDQSSESGSREGMNLGLLSWIHDLQGQMIWVSAHWSLPSSRRFPDFLAASQTAENYQRRMDRWVEGIRHDRPFNLEFDWRSPEGRVVPVVMTLEPVLDASGKPLLWVGCASEFGPPNHSDEPLKIAVDRFHSLVTAAAQTVWTTDPTGNVICPSPTWAEFTGQRFDEYRGMGWLDAVHPLDQPHVLAAWTQAVQRAELYETEYRVQARDGTYRWTAVRGVPVLKPDGTIREWVGMNTDITDAKRADEALRKSEERLRLALETEPIALWDMDARTHVAFWSKGHFAIFGYPPTATGEASLEMWLDLVPERDRNQVVQAIERARSEKNLFCHEHRILRADNQSEVWLLPFGKFHYDEHGNAIRFIGVFFDITRPKREHLDLRRVAEDLSVASRRKDEFLATLAHELRNPLAPIRNALQIIRLSTDCPPDLLNLGAMMERQVEQLVHLVDDLLDICRISQGKMRLKKGPVDLRAVLGTAVDAVSPLMIERQHTLNVLLTEGPAPVFGDAHRLSQAFTNILANAAKYTDRGGSISLILENTATDVLVRCVDNGIGMTPQMTESIFTLFMQAETGLDRACGGLGIGLAVVKRLIEMHEGTIRAHSPGLGLGSTFCVRLPRFQQTAIVATHTGVDPATIRSLARRRILVVDDDRDSTQSLSLLLSMFGQDVRIAGDCLSALDAVLEFRPEIVFLDLIMPGLSGYDTCQRIRNLKYADRCTIVALSGALPVENVPGEALAGFDTHLLKPVEPQELCSFLAGQ